MTVRPYTDWLPNAFHHQPLPLPDQHPCQLAGTRTLGTVIARTTLGGQVVSVDVRDAGGCVHRRVLAGDVLEVPANVVWLVRLVVS